MKFVHLADYASVDRSGKLNLLGVFGNMNVPTLPCTHPLMCLAANLEFPPNEVGREGKFTLKLLEPDGRKIAQLGPFDFKVPPSPVDGMPVLIPIVVMLRDLKVEKNGPHSWKVEIDGDTKYTCPMDVTLVSTKEEKNE